MEPRFDILYLTIDGVEVERVRVFGSDKIKESISGLKKAYNLLPHHDYIFYVVRQSSMNKNIKLL